MPANESGPSKNSRSEAQQSRSTLLSRLICSILLGAALVMCVCTISRFVMCDSPAIAGRTMESLARLLIASPVSGISQSRSQHTTFSNNIMMLYKLRGYRTLFITSGNGSWRNIATFLKELGFDEVVEQSALIRKYPEAKMNTWDTYDEFSFRYAEEQLAQADKKHEPIFI